MNCKIRRIGNFAFAIVLACVIPSALSAATFKSVATKDGKTLILLAGEIIEGDADTLKAAIKAANDAGKLVSGVRLNSPGGNLLEGLKLADAVRFAKVATNIAANATCASACFLIYAAGATKFANYNAQVGVHGASDKQGEETGIKRCYCVHGPGCKRPGCTGSDYWSNGRYAAERDGLAYPSGFAVDGNDDDREASSDAYFANSDGHR